MTVIVVLCLIVLFLPMGFVNAGDGESNSPNMMSTSLAGTLLSAGAENIKEDVAAINYSVDENADESPETSDRTPVFIITTIAVVSFICMATLCIKEYVL